MNKYILYTSIILILISMIFIYISKKNKESFVNKMVIRAQNNRLNNRLAKPEPEPDSNLNDILRNYGHKPSDCEKGTLWDGTECNRVSGRLPLNLYFDNLNLKNMATDNDNVCAVDSYNYVWCADNVNNPKWKIVPFSEKKEMSMNGTETVSTVPDLRLKNLQLKNKVLCGTNDKNEVFCTDNYKKPNFKKIG
jgi:hypothetical protein